MAGFLFGLDAAWLALSMATERHYEGQPAFPGASEVKQAVCAGVIQASGVRAVV
jgi:hypothetical protein